MNKILTLLILSVFTCIVAVEAQNPRYLIEFTDKDSLHNPYTMDNADEFLSQEALLRREQQNIELTNEDLPISPRYIDSLKNRGIRIQNKSKWMNSIVAVLDTAIRDSLKKYEFIEKITYLAPPRETSQKSVHRAEQSMHISSNTSKSQVDSSTYGFAANQIMMLNGDHLHKNGFRGEGKTIAIVDAGFPASDSLPVFDSLWANQQILGQRDFEDPSNNLYEDGNRNHGTYVLSVIGSNSPGVLYGSAPGSDFWLLRSEVGSSEYLVEEYNWIAAAEFADSAGVDVINTSLGYTRFDDSLQNHTYYDMDGKSTAISLAASIAASKGMLIVVSAGNKGNDPWRYISAPADAENILAVGAVDEFGMYASFSSVGPTADNRIKPEVTAQGQGTFIATPSGSIAAGNGTSFSSPIIAGLSACLWQQYPEKTSGEIRDMIIRSCDQYNNPDSLKGYGIPDFSIASDINKIQQAEKKIRVYPNPFKDSFQIELPDIPLKFNKVTLSIYNVLGKKVYMKTFSSDVVQQTLTIEPKKAQQEGVYFITIRYNDHYTLRKKILKSSN